MLIEDITLPRGLLTRATANLPDQQLTVLLGANGSGKSTLLNRLAQKLPQAAYLPQHNQVYDEISVSDLLDLGAQRTNTPLSIDVITALDLNELLSSNLEVLSGGQQQRVWLAFVLLQNAPVILLDEPLNALDLRYQKSLFKLLPQLKVNILLVVHDLNYARQLADWVWVLHEHKLLEGTPSTLLTVDKLSTIFATPVTEVQATDGTTFLRI